MSTQTVFCTQLGQLYNLYRSSILNKKYYGARLAAFKRWNMRLEILIAVGTSTAIGTWALWRGDRGSIAWAIITGFVTVLAIIKPFLQLSRRVEKYSKLFVGHADVEWDVKKLVDSTPGTQSFTPAMRETYQSILDRIRKLAVDDDPNPDEELREKCADEVNTEVPLRVLWYPEEPPK